MPTASHPPQPDSPRQTLLIADDDGGLRSTLSDVFEPHFNVVTADSGRDALGLLNESHTDLALFDMQMGEVSGLDLIGVIRQRRLILPCLLMTARPTGDVLERAESLGVTPVLRKPFGLRQVVDSVVGLIERAYGRDCVPTGLN